MYTSVFIIDDYQINLRVAEMIIKTHGFFDKITSYTEAEKALSYITINRNDAMCLPDIILLDLSMPVMDGWQFLDEFEIISKSLQKNICIFILSSSTDNHDIQRSKQYSSVKGYLSKPLSHDMLKYIMDVIILASAS